MGRPSHRSFHHLLELNDRCEVHRDWGGCDRIGHRRRDAYDDLSGSHLQIVVNNLCIICVPVEQSTAAVAKSVAEHNRVAGV